jgi:hypothetical protein
MPQPLGNNSPESILTPPSQILQIFGSAKRQILSSQQLAYLQPFMSDIAINHYASLEKMPIAAGFALLPLTEIAKENAKRDVPMVGLTQQWLLFASASNGDAWLIRKHDNDTEVAFLDSLQGKQAIAQPLEIDFNQWLQLAYLMHQLEMCMISLSKADIYAALNRLHPELSKRYPYAVSQ